MQYRSQILIICLIFSLTSLSQSPDCKCYTVHDLQMRNVDTLELRLTNTCSSWAYLNMYVISTAAPFDTLARWEQFWGFIPPDGNPKGSYLLTTLTEVPEFQSYRVAITNEVSPGSGISCDSLQFSLQMSVAGLQAEAERMVYPNPARGFIICRVKPDDEIVIRNTLGQKIYQEREAGRIDLSGWARGLYFLDIYDGSGNGVARFRIISD